MILGAIAIPPDPEHCGGCILDMVEIDGRQTRSLVLRDSKSRTCRSINDCLGVFLVPPTNRDVVGASERDANILIPAGGWMVHCDWSPPRRLWCISQRVSLVLHPFHLSCTIPTAVVTIRRWALLDLVSGLLLRV